MIATFGDETVYFSCTAKFGAELKGAAPAFEKACQAVGFTKG